MPSKVGNYKWDLKDRKSQQIGWPLSLAQQRECPCSKEGRICTLMPYNALEAKLIEVLICWPFVTSLAMPPQRRQPQPEGALSSVRLWKKLRRGLLDAGSHILI